MSHPNIPLVTASAAIVLALLQMGLMNWAAFGRAKYSTGLGDGGHDALARRIRMHGNLAENAPIFLILLGLAEWSGEWDRILPAVAIAFVLARIAHVIGLSQTSGASIPRMTGATGTFLLITLLAVLLAITLVSRA
jgi:uncharacterized membrane protein YecN with MAPEG domain